MLKERSKLVSYKKENQKVIINADQENEEEIKPRKLEEKRKRDSQGQQQQKRNILVTGHSMLTGILGKSLSKKHNISVAGFSGGTSKKIIENLDDLLKNQPGDTLIHVGTNDITNRVNLLNKAIKIAKQVSDFSPRRIVAFSPIIVRKDIRKTFRSL